MPFQVHISPILWWGDFQAWSATQPMKAESTHWHATCRDEKGGPREVCEPLRKLMSAKTEWTWNTTYQKMLHKGQAIIKKMCTWNSMMKLNQYNIETDASTVWLGAALLQTKRNRDCHRDKVLDNSILRPIAFASKSLTSAEKRYSNIGREALGIPYGLEKFYHYCFVRELSIIMDHKPLITILKKEVTTLLQMFQWILLRIH